MPLANRKLNPEAEQYLKVLEGETPLWVPRFGLVGPPANKYSTTAVPSKGLMSTWMPRRKPTEDGKFIDAYGVVYVPTEETGGAALPEPDNFILDDIRKWRDVIKNPDISEINWELQCQRDLDAMGDFSEFVISLGAGAGFFQPLMAYMGFTNGLIAMYEEPEEVHALYDYLAAHNATILENQLKYWGGLVDVLGVGDDTATANNPFISPEMYRQLIKPYVSRLAKYGQDRGYHIMMHNCGRCEDSIDDWRDFGVDSWNPAQITNDLDAIKAKYGNSLVLIGCWDSSGPVGWPDAPEEFVREEVRKCMMHYGKGGGFMFYGSSYGPVDDEASENKKRWLTEAYEDYREEPYK